MLIIYFVIMCILIAILSYIITRAICRARVERKNKEFANLPKEVLLQHALIGPIYNAYYRSLLTFMSEEMATDTIIRRMLIDMGLIGYRKEGP